MQDFCEGNYRVSLQSFRFSRITRACGIVIDDDILGITHLKSAGDYVIAHLILVDLTVLQFGLALLLECDDYQGHENINEEERKHNKVNDIKDGHFYAKILDWTLVFVGSCHRVLKDSAGWEREANVYAISNCSGH